MILFVRLDLCFKSAREAALIMATLPFALTGGFWCLDAMGSNQAIATGVGFIALAGVAAEFGVILLIDLKQAWATRLEAGLSAERLSAQGGRNDHGAGG